ncbi:uncharacterized protein MONOS_14519 [Monocercomonoides exilis]|uniref:uncharacterized protein n=1 Tax=Monocercomonoides exilis TaxID=2049356 RepID=UPI003559AE26|nr:hypothetical protein MONOS_14519 [Monocercomonoides exilis]|eukprot:MONOS_14519.1-p1 / transcript=MONOS_14519.1 / gene=MONOS_14519 / organism=Monocercomonoides_exilis_PA203 / gene_product=unspecified product / transcript_product=unspecified product / location=Mono_scaffold01017:2329-2978(+) / protein_length=117 / sequence_SO=supercontig / SO=protein_coding / is_pseudo=false
MFSRAVGAIILHKRGRGSVERGKDDVEEKKSMVYVSANEYLVGAVEGDEIGGYRHLDRCRGRESRSRSRRKGVFGERGLDDVDGKEGLVDLVGDVGHLRNKSLATKESFNAKWRWR